MHAAGKVDFWWASLDLPRDGAGARRYGGRGATADSCDSAGATSRSSSRVGIGDTLGNVLFAASSGHGLVSLTAVLASLYPIVTVILAAAVLRERVAPLQKAGIALTLDRRRADQRVGR